MSKKVTQPKALIGLGSIVRLKSGGPNMTIVGFPGLAANVASVIWFNVAGNIFKADIGVLALNIVKA